ARRTGVARSRRGARTFRGHVDRLRERRDGRGGSGRADDRRRRRGHAHAARGRGEAAVGRVADAPVSGIFFMKSLLLLVCAALGSALTACAADDAKTSADRLASGVYDWEKMAVTPNAKGVRRAVFDGATATVDKIHCHITTLNPGEKSGEPSKHLQEEVIIVKEGTVEANWDGKSETGGPGSFIFFAAGATTFLRNAGSTPCTYTVFYYYTPQTP